MKKIYTQKDLNNMLIAETKMTLAVVNDLLGTKLDYTTSLVGNKVQSTALLILEAKEEVKEECVNIVKKAGPSTRIGEAMRSEIVEKIRRKRYLVPERSE